MHRNKHRLHPQSKLYQAVVSLGLEREEKLPLKVFQRWWKEWHYGRVVFPCSSSHGKIICMPLEMCMVSQFHVIRNSELNCRARHDAEKSTSVSTMMSVAYTGTQSLCIERIALNVFLLTHISWLRQSWAWIWYVMSVVYSVCFIQTPCQLEFKFIDAIQRYLYLWYSSKHLSDWKSTLHKCI